MNCKSGVSVPGWMFAWLKEKGSPQIEKGRPAELFASRTSLNRYEIPVREVCGRGPGEVIPTVVVSGTPLSLDWVARFKDKESHKNHLNGCR